MNEFTAEIELLGINPFVFVPDGILQEVFKESGMEKGRIPIKGEINQIPYIQTLVKYKGFWRLYINNVMLKNSPKRIGEVIHVTIAFDSTDRTIEAHPDLVRALSENTGANEVFESLTVSKQQEIVRYISRLRTEESRAQNVKRAINFLVGNERFLGRDKP